MTKKKNQKDYHLSKNQAFQRHKYNYLFLDVHKLHDVGGGKKSFTFPTFLNFSRAL
jgi:hypothetical protein